MATGKNKLLSFVFLASILLLCISCQHDPPESEPADARAAETEHVHTPVPLPDVPPTCEADGHTGGVQCSTCNYYIELPSTVEKLGHTCETGLCDRCGRFLRNGVPAPETGIWHDGVFLDVFGDPTDEGCVYSDTISGTFSNSATADSSLSVLIFESSNKFMFDMYEYDKYIVSSSIYSIEAHIKFGDKKEILYPYFQDNSLVFSGRAYERLHALLAAGLDVQFVILEQDGTSTYKFTVKASNYVTSYIDYRIAIAEPNP